MQLDWCYLWCTSPESGSLKSLLHGTGTIPSHLGNLLFLVELHFRNNSFYGRLLNELVGLRSLKFVSLGYNSFRGNIPSWLGSLPKLQSLHLNGNKFSGSIPNSIFNLSSLEVLDLDNNKLSGPVPLFLFNMSSLTILALSGNNLTSRLPGLWVPNLEELYLGMNNLIGTVPGSISNASNLILIDMDNPLNTHLTLPISLGNLSTSLLDFDLGNCKLRGKIPEDIGNFSSMIALNLSYNGLSGPIPASVGRLQKLQDNNKLMGPIPLCMDNLGTLRILSFGSNELTSSIPSNLWSLAYILHINLSSNSLTGSLPMDVGNLKVVTDIDLSNSQLSSNISTSIGGLKDLVSLVFGNNNLEGSALVLKYVVPAIFSTILLVALVFIISTWCRRRNLKPALEASISPYPAWRKVSYQDLLRATNGFSEGNLLGIGSFGSVYKGILSDGMFVVVKVLNLQVEEASKSFHAECEVLRNIRHRNLVTIVCSCSNQIDFKALVLGYMPNGSLEKLLYSESYADMVAHVVDFGISRLLSSEDSMTQTMTLATYGSEVITEEDDIPSIIHIPKQIVPKTLKELIPLEWFTRYEQLHKGSTPLVSMDPLFQSMTNGTVRTSVSKSSSKASSSRVFHTLMITPASRQYNPDPDKDIPVTKFNLDGSLTFVNHIDGHFIWDVDSSKCHPYCDCDWEDDSDDECFYSQRRKKKAEKSQCKPQNSPRSPPTNSSAHLPIYRKALKILEKRNFCSYNSAMHDVCF
ncbi:hypothetical protein FNV43_RR07395 [Rhamnella rubrinervis]|uniref:Protein kinase domain-containing protein n=1 Tax=Rhamnella rubrinervis TaxID=2594499 RepID=A0A8K0HFA3_9ROSA|nr:hypothetical protein FNV43_RR07395 [Rhamnella rubrinervis]